MTLVDFTFSQSSLQDYVDCPRRFQLRYIEQLAWPAVETEPALENERRQKEGQFFHRLVQQHRLGLPEDKLRRLASTSDLSRWWDHYLAYDFKLEGYAEHSELTLSAPIGSYRLLAKYDLVAVKQNGKVLVYDWKTYHKRPEDERMAARLQTRVYRALLVQAGASLNGGVPILPEQIEMVYWYADFPAQPALFPYTSAQYRRDWDSLTSLIGEIGHHGHFELTEDETKCAYCPYRSYCNRGLTAGSEAEIDPETELASLEINFEQIQEIEF
ncbi:MAG: PD-(D/E)XK nuclease family protein [Anaerolineales bacterium]|jgi:CRISPR/Cas system-associated exonuclease Cas4 (RecB family)